MNKRVIDSAYRWWQAMFLSENELKKLGIRPAPSAQKAQLKRCVNIDAAMLTDGFRALWLSFPEEFANESKPELIECWAAIALTLVFVKQNSEVELASLAGQKVDGDKSLVSELRFSQLQNSVTPDEFVKRLRRILLQVDNKTAVKPLMLDIQQWFVEHYNFRPQTPTNRIAVLWAMKYYQAAK